MGYTTGYAIGGCKRMALRAPIDRTRSLGSHARTSGWACWPTTAGVVGARVAAGVRGTSCASAARGAAREGSARRRVVRSRVRRGGRSRVSRSGAARASTCRMAPLREAGAFDSMFEHEPGSGAGVRPVGCARGHARPALPFPPCGCSRAVGIAGPSRWSHGGDYRMTGSR